MTRLRQPSMSVIGAFSVILLGVLTVVVFSGIFRVPFEGGAREVTADFERAPQLRKGDQVRVNGNIDGKVKDIQPGPRAEEARVTLKVDREAGPLYNDARARLRVKTLLGGAFYVELDRGTKQAGPLGERVITSDRTSVQVEVEDITGIFRDGAVTGLQTLPGELATALSDPAPPAAALRTLSRIAPDAATALEAVRGQDPGADLRELVDASAKTVKALDSENGDLKTLVAGAAATLEVSGRRASEIRSAIDQSDTVTAVTKSTLARLDSTLDITRGLVGRLQRSAPDVAPTLAALRPTLASTATLLRGAEPLVRLLRPTLLSLGQSTPKGIALIDEVEPSLARTDDKILPYFARKDPVTGRSTTVMIGGTAAGFGGAASQQDANGHFIRFPASMGATSAYLPCKSSLIDPTAASQLACDSFNDALSNYLKYLPKFQPLSRVPDGRAGR